MKKKKKKGRKKKITIFACPFYEIDTEVYTRSIYNSINHMTNHIQFRPDFFSSWIGGGYGGDTNDKKSFERSRQEERMS